jgi:excisionase family DNA binding protein
MPKKAKPRVMPEPLAVTVPVTCHLLSLSLDRVYDLIRNGELDSYLDGDRRRRITMRSIKAHPARQLRAQNGGRGNEPARYAPSPYVRRRRLREAAAPVEND